MDINFNGFGENVATFIKENNVENGMLVSMSDDNFTVKPAERGDEIFGVCVGVRDDYAAIQLSGYVETKYVLSMRTGIVGLAVHNAKSIKIDDNSTKYKIIYVDKKKQIVGFVL